MNFPICSNCNKIIYNSEEVILSNKLFHQSCINKNVPTKEKNSNTKEETKIIIEEEKKISSPEDDFYDEINSDNSEFDSDDITELKKDFSKPDPILRFSRHRSLSIPYVKSLSGSNSKSNFLEKKVNLTPPPTSKMFHLSPSIDTLSLSQTQNHLSLAQKSSYHTSSHSFTLSSDENLITPGSKYHRRNTIASLDYNFNPFQSNEEEFEELNIESLDEIRYDGLKLQNDQSFLKLLCSRDEEIYFSDVVSKINRKNKEQERILVITDEYLYNFASLKHLKRKIHLMHIKNITITDEDATKFLIHVYNEYDYFFKTQKRDLIIRILCSLVRLLDDEIVSHVKIHKIQKNENIASYIVTKPQFFQMKTLKQNQKRRSLTSQISAKIRHLVSGSRLRFQIEDFDLDLSFINNQIIAMGFPGEGIEQIARNPYSEVYSFLESHYHDHYKVFNLCANRSYPSSKFHNRVSRYGFDDHNVPTLEMVLTFCEDVDNFLHEDESNVVAVHCLAGKGRTGTMISCYLIYSKICINPSEAISLFGSRRSKDGVGVTWPSQIRWVEYFYSYMCFYHNIKPFKWKGIPMNLLYIRLTTVPHVSQDGGCNPFICLFNNQREKYYDSRNFQRPTHIKPNVNYIEFISNARIEGHFQIALYTQSFTREVLLCYVWLHTSFLPNNYSVFYKNEIDMASRDPLHKTFNENFKIELFYRVLDDEHKQ